jgi:putative Holliday junction resolvase
MPFLSASEAKALKQTGRPLLALDLGSKRIGVAICDRTWLIASPLVTLDHKKFTLTAQAIIKLYHENKACCLVIGLPLNMDGSSGPRVQSVQDFGRNLLALSPDLCITYFDERLSTHAVESILIEADLSRAKRKKVVDKLAAAYILQSFLDSCPTNPSK